MASYAEVEDGEEDDSDDDGPGDEGSNANVEAVKQVGTNTVYALRRTITLYMLFTM